MIAEAEEEDNDEVNNRYVDATDEDKSVQNGIKLSDAFLIPGVLEYSISFFCVKFCVYSFLLWLPSFLDGVYHFDKPKIANV